MRASCFGVCAVLLLGACKPSNPSCVDGELSACSCPGGKQGVHACTPDGAFGPCACGGNGAPGNLPDYPVRNLASDAPYVDVNAEYLFQIDVAGTGWGVLGVSAAQDAPSLRIDLYDDQGKLLKSTSDTGSCGGGASPNKTAFVAINGHKNAGRTLYGIVSASGAQYVVEWYEASTKVPPVPGANVGCESYACEAFPSGHVAHAFDVEMKPGMIYGLLHSDSCGCGGVSEEQSAQFVVDSGSVRGDIATAGDALSVAPTCSACGADQGGITVDAEADPQQGVVIVDTIGEARQAVSLCYGLEATGCPPPYDLCGGGCLDTQTDVDACGSCTPCSQEVENATGLSCNAGKCDYAACSAGYFDCDGDPSNGCETAEPSVASTCSAVENAAATCAKGQCEYTGCNAGYLDCDGARQNGCEVDCTALANAAGPVCASGGCGYTACNAGFLDCDGNPQNGCERDCRFMNATGLSCSAGGCDYTACAPGYSDNDNDRSNGCESHGPYDRTLLATGEWVAAGIAVDATNVYWTTGGAQDIRTVPIAGGTPTTVGTSAYANNGLAVDDSYVYASQLYAPVSRTPKAGGTWQSIGDATDVVGIYAVGGKVVWAYANTIQLSAGSAATTLATGASTVSAVSVDASNVYFIDANGINRVPLAGGSPTVVAQAGSGALAMAVDASSVYWVDTSALHAASISTGSVQTLATLGCAPRRLLVDATKAYVACTTEIDAVPLGGGTVTVLADGQSNASDIAVDAANVYWVDTGAGSVWKVAK